MCNKAVENYLHALEFVPECYKTQNMCDKAVNTYSATIEFVPKCYNIQKVCAKAFNKHLFVFDSILD